MAYIKTKLQRDFEIDEIITIHYFEYMKDFYFAGEAHDFWEFLYVDKGVVKVCGDEEEYLLRAGDVIFHQPNEFHTIQSKGDKSPNLVAVSFCCHSPAMSQFAHKCCSLAERERTLISWIIEEAKQAFSTPLHLPSVEQIGVKQDAPFGSQQLILNYLEQFLIEVKRSHSLSAPKSMLHVLSSLNPHPKSERIQLIMQYLEFHICEHITIQDVCNAVSLSRASVERLFKKEKGCGVIDYFNQMKIDRAKEIIKDERMTITETAHYLSYNSLQYFSNQFKKMTGMSPLEYLRSVKENTKAVQNAKVRIAAHDSDCLPPPKRAGDHDFTR